MKNEELIELLKKLPKDLDIVFTNNNGYYKGEDIDDPFVGEYKTSSRYYLEEGEEFPKHTQMFQTDRRKWYFKPNETK
jgi:hypothetical protein